MSDTRVFISHRQSDSARAKSWADFLKRNSIDCYLDTLDPTPQQLAGRAVSKYLHRQLQACTHLLVIFTKNTDGSMWVPFEIGISTERDIGIAIDLTTSIRDLPEYLLEWPVLENDASHQAFLEQLRRAYTVRDTTKSQGRRYSDQFHESLKRAIGQP